MFSPRLGDFVVLSIDCGRVDPTVIQGIVVGLMEGFDGPDSIRVKLAGLDVWVDVDESVLGVVANG